MFSYVQVCSIFSTSDNRADDNIIVIQQIYYFTVFILTVGKVYCLIKLLINDYIYNITINMQQYMLYDHALFNLF